MTAFSFTRSLASLSFSNSLINFVILKLMSSLWSTLASDPEGVKIVTSGSVVRMVAVDAIASMVFQEGHIAPTF